MRMKYAADTLRTKTLRRHYYESALPIMTQTTTLQYEAPCECICSQIPSDFISSYARPYCSFFVFDTATWT